MNNLYHRVAVASVGIALGFSLGVNKEAKAATFTFTLTNASGFFISDTNLDGVADWAYGGAIPLPVGLQRDENSREYTAQHRAFYDFNLPDLSLAPDTVIRSAVFQTTVNRVEGKGSYFQLLAYGYNERDDFSSLFDAGEYLDSKNVNIIMQEDGIATFNVLPFINQRITNNDSFAGFGIRGTMGDDFLRDKGEGHIYLNSNATLTIVTERVPEPTTIFGSALALGVGGWLKRKKSSQQNKTKASL